MTATQISAEVLELAQHMYTAEDLQRATAAVQAEMSCSEASRRFKIPRQTLSNRIKGSNLGFRGGGPLLSKDSESESSQWMKDCAALGDPRTPKQFLKAAGKRSLFSEKMFKNRTPTRHYIKRFLKRNDGISLRKPQSISRAAANVKPFPGEHLQHSEIFDRERLRSHTR